MTTLTMKTIADLPVHLHNANLPDIAAYFGDDVGKGRSAKLDFATTTVSLVEEGKAMKSDAARLYKAFVDAEFKKAGAEAKPLTAGTLKQQTSTYGRLFEKNVVANYRTLFPIVIGMQVALPAKMRNKNSVFEALLDVCKVQRLVSTCLDKDTVKGLLIKPAKEEKTLLDKLQDMRDACDAMTEKHGMDTASIVAAINVAEALEMKAIENRLADHDAMIARQVKEAAEAEIRRRDDAARDAAKAEAAKAELEASREAYNAAEDVIVQQDAAH